MEPCALLSTAYNGKLKVCQKPNVLLRAPVPEQVLQRPATRLVPVYYFVPILQTIVELVAKQHQQASEVTLLHSQMMPTCALYRQHYQPDRVHVCYRQRWNSCSWPSSTSRPFRWHRCTARWMPTCALWVMTRTQRTCLLQPATMQHEAMWRGLQGCMPNVASLMWP